eukprot:scaffold41865_cov45-Cyclotella_meneghiniana.AAC.1
MQVKSRQRLLLCPSLKSQHVQPIIVDNEFHSQPCPMVKSRQLLLPHPSLKSQHVQTIVDNEFHSQPCLTIHHTHNETLEQSSCCAMGMKSRQLLLPHRSLKSQHVQTIVDNEFHSQPCLTIHHTLNKTLEQSSYCAMGVRI